MMIEECLIQKQSIQFWHFFLELLFWHLLRPSKSWPIASHFFRTIVFFRTLVQALLGKQVLAHNPCVCLGPLQAIFPFLSCWIFRGRGKNAHSLTTKYSLCIEFWIFGSFVERFHLKTGYPKELPAGLQKQPRRPRPSKGSSRSWKSSKKNLSFPTSFFFVEKMSFPTYGFPSVLVLFGWLENQPRRGWVGGPSSPAEQDGSQLHTKREKMVTRSDQTLE